MWLEEVDKEECILVIQKKRGGIGRYLYQRTRRKTRFGGALGVGELQKDGFEEFEASGDAIIWIQQSGLNTKNQ